MEKKRSSFALFPEFSVFKRKVEEAFLHFEDLAIEILSLFVVYRRLSEAVRS